MGVLSKGGNGMGEHDERVEGRWEYAGDGEAIGMYVEDSGLTLKRCLGIRESEKNGLILAQRLPWTIQHAKLGNWPGQAAPGEGWDPSPAFNMFQTFIKLG